MKQTVLVMGNISPEDIDLLHIVDEPDEVCDIITNRYKDRIRTVHRERRQQDRKGV